MPLTIIIGAQWGDEGKGHITDRLAQSAAVVARYSGGDNAGHTVTIGDDIFKLHLIPSGIIHAGVVCLIGNGAVVNPAVLLREMDGLAGRGVDVSPSRLKLSGSAHLITPGHIAMDRAHERERGRGAIGTTLRGIGPAYTDKARRVGLRAQLLADPAALATALREHLAAKNDVLDRVYGEEPLEIDAIAAEFAAHAARLAPHLVDGPLLLDEALARGGTVLAEGAQGTLLDLDHGTYPYSYNNPINYTDPSGHCAGNPDGVGNSFDENLCWSNVATIGNLWEHTDYWKGRWGSYEDFVLNVGSNPLLGTDFFSDELLRYTQSDQYKVWSAQLASSYPPSPPPLDTGEYWVLGLTTPLPFPLFLGFKVIRDDWGVWYFNVHEASAPGFSIMRGQIFVNDTTKPTDAKALADFPAELQADLARAVLPGISGGASAGWYLVGGGVNVASGSNAHVYVEGGLYRPGASSEIGYTFVAPWLR